MKLNYNLLFIGIGFFLWLACSSNAELNIDDETQIEIDNMGETTEDNEIEPSSKDTLKILSLGDSYTIGQSVCDTCRFPAQLRDSLNKRIDSTDKFELEIIATTGWTTTNLINAIASENPSSDFDLVTLLIGVNNEFRKKPFSLYETEFPQLVNTAIKKAKGDKSNLIVISIPDYAFTPFGNGNTEISTRLDAYNNFAEQYCAQNNISYVYITDITRQGLNNPELVASDKLHPSTLAYTKFVERILPIAIEKIEVDNN
ncbi:SGNH/GDSL hydrolase family protein [Hyunsoonleella sp. SJ7]|uniref:SGNH/GDSL hydrolase family protein n=1 Tax=Hyunsoonleella aquatilis TaxID=2762758 RepID=A0A923HCQ5_9FLAO|nr:SGNH/GDSL hydrolase family protein [Hyunsoonleella aquatilis]MBC3757020.1 SGNH/GDSL hydrolase family protein [Hyunsoonleella aquatilis]